MLKSFFEWLISTIPIHNWVLLLMLLGLIASIAFALKNSERKHIKGE